MKNRLKELRKLRGLTLAQVADATGFSNQQISHLENGRRNLTVEWLERLATVLKCDPLEILEDVAMATTPQEKHLLRVFRKISPEQRSAFLKAAIALIEPDRSFK